MAEKGEPGWVTGAGIWSVVFGKHTAHRVLVERHVYRLDNLPAEIADAIEAARMDPAHDHLNELLDDD